MRSFLTNLELIFPFKKYQDNTSFRDAKEDFFMNHEKNKLKYNLTNNYII